MGRSRYNNRSLLSISARIAASPAVLYVCQHGSAKSIIAAAHFARLADEHRLGLQAMTAGLEPDDALPPNVAEGLLADGFDESKYHPRRVTAGELAEAVCVVSFGCDLADLGAQASRVERWDNLPFVSDGYASARDAIVLRLRALIPQLALASKSQRTPFP